MDLTEDYVISVLGHDPQRPSHDKIKAKYQKVHGVLGWDSADVLRLLNEFTWEEELALDAAVDQKYQKGGDWVPTGGKKKEKKPAAPPQSNQKASRGRGASQQQKSEVQNSQRGGGRSRGGNQPESGNRGGRGRGRGSSSAGRGKPAEIKSPQQNQSSAGRVDSEGPKQPAAAPAHPIQSVPTPAPAVEAIQQPPASSDSDSNASSQGLQGEWALRAQRKRLESTQPPPQKGVGHAQQFGHPHQRHHPHSHPHHSHPHSHPHQQLHPHQQHGQHVQQLHPQSHSQRSSHEQHQAHEQHEPVSNVGRDLDHLENILEETHISDDHHHSQLELEESNPSASHSVVDNPQVDHSGHHDVQLEVHNHPSASGIADPVCLAPGLPGVDTTNYQFRFVFENDEAEKDTVEVNPTEHSDVVEISPESQNEKSQDHQTESRNEQHSSQPFDQPQKAPNMPYPQHSQFENLEEPPMSQQIFYGYQQIPPVYLQQPPRNDPSLKVHNDMNPAVLPHLLAPPNPFFSGLYPGSHHLLGDQQFPFNPLPSDPAMNDMRVARMYGMDLGYPFHPQHQNPHGQHPDAQQPNLRNSPPINGSPNQFSSGNASANPNANAESSKFTQSQQHEMNGIHGSGPLHDIQSHQPNPQMSHQHHQPFPYYYQPFIHGQFPLHVPMRSPYYGAHKGHPGHPPSSFPQVIDMHGAHGPHQPSYFPQELKGQKPQHIPVMYGHPSEGQEGAFEKSQSQSSSQQPQQQQSHLPGDLHKGQGFGYNFSYQGQPQN